MTQAELNRTVAHITGESVSEVARVGFTLVETGPVPRKPRIANWDRVAGCRSVALFPDRRRPVG